MLFEGSGRFALLFFKRTSDIAWGRLDVVTPFHHLSEDSHINCPLRAGPITASNLIEKALVQLVLLAWKLPHTSRSVPFALGATKDK
jgi:hypothetical protein